MTLTAEDLQAIELRISRAMAPISDRMDSLEKNVSSISQRLTSLEQTVAEIKEDTTVTREAVNSLVEWADKVVVVTNVPVPVRNSN